MVLLIDSFDSSLREREKTHHGRTGRAVPYFTVQRLLRKVTYVWRTKVTSPFIGEMSDS
jgi:hypothetical protein